MEEQVLLKSERMSVLRYSLLIVAAGGILLASYLCYELIRYAPEFRIRAESGYGLYDYHSPLDMAMKLNGAFPFVVICIPVVFIAMAVLFYCAYSKTDVTVTDRRIMGYATFGKRVDIPLASVFAAKTGGLKGLDIATAYGTVHLKLLKNQQTLCSVIKKLAAENQPCAASAAPAVQPQETIKERAVMTPETYYPNKLLLCTVIGIIALFTSVLGFIPSIIARNMAYELPLEYNVTDVSRARRIATAAFVINLIELIAGAIIGAVILVISL